MLLSALWSERLRNFVFQVTSKSFNGTDKASGFHAQWNPLHQEIEGIVAHICNGPYRAVRWFLSERGPQTVGTGVAIHVKREEAVGYDLPVGQYQNQWGGELDQNLSYDNLHSRCRTVLNLLR